MIQSYRKSLEDRKIHLVFLEPFHVKGEENGVLTNTLNSKK